jgi:hypothetical protein
MATKTSRKTDITKARGEAKPDHKTPAKAKAAAKPKAAASLKSRTPPKKATSAKALTTPKTASRTKSQKRPKAAAPTKAGEQSLAMSTAAGGAAASPTGVRLDVEDFVRVALRVLPRGWMTPSQVKAQVDLLQPGYDLEDFLIALDLLSRPPRREIQKSNDGRYCERGCA